jgi:hypothetical protein
MQSPMHMIAAEPLNNRIQDKEANAKEELHVNICV